MNTARYVYWQDSDAFIGYLEDFPDYLTQGASLSDLEEHLRDIFQDVTGGHIPQVRRVAQLSLA